MSPRLARGKVRQGEREREGRSGHFYAGTRSKQVIILFVHRWVFGAEFEHTTIVTGAQRLQAGPARRCGAWEEDGKRGGRMYC